MPPEHQTPPTLITLHLSHSSSLNTGDSKHSHATASPLSVPQIHQKTSSTTTQIFHPHSSRRKNTPKEHLSPSKEWQLNENTTLSPDDEERTCIPLPPPPPPPNRRPSPSRHTCQSVQHVPSYGNAGTSTNTNTSSNANNPARRKDNTENKIRGGRVCHRKFPTIADLDMIRQPKRQNVQLRDYGFDGVREEMESGVLGAGSGSEGDISGEGEDEKREEVDCDKDDKERRAEKRQEDDGNDEGSGEERDEDGKRGEEGSAKDEIKVKFRKDAENKDESMEDRLGREESQGIERNGDFGTVEGEIDCCEDNDGDKTKEVEKMCEERKNLTKRRRIG